MIYGKINLLMLQRVKATPAASNRIDLIRKKEVNQGNAFCRKTPQKMG
jgi:hypothetical protein